MSNNETSKRLEQVDTHIRVHVDGTRLRVTAQRSSAAGVIGALFCVFLGSSFLLFGTKYGDTRESRLLFAGIGYMLAIACIAMTFQKEYVCLDLSSDVFEHRWTSGWDPRRTRLSELKGPTVATELRRGMFPEHRLRFDDFGTSIDTLVDHDRAELENAAREIVKFLGKSRS